MALHSALANEFGEPPGLDSIRSRPVSGIAFAGNPNSSGSLILYMNISPFRLEGRWWEGIIWPDAISTFGRGLSGEEKQ